MQKKTVFKITSDSLVLGAYASKITGKTVLDIGSGTGVLSAMYLMKNPGTEIFLVDVNEDAIKLCQENLLQFSSQSHFFKGKIQDFNEDKIFDLIISNPPYFTKSLKSESHVQNRSKHNDSLSFSDFWQKIYNVSADTTTIIVILNKNEVKRFNQEAELFGFYLNFNLDIIGREGGDVKLNLLRYSTMLRKRENGELIIRKKDNTYHHNYINLLKDYLVIF